MSLDSGMADSVLINGQTLAIFQPYAQVKHAWREPHGRARANKIRIRSKRKKSQNAE